MTEPLGPPAFAVRTRVGAADIDDLGHANNVHYLRWMLEAATAHWDWFRGGADPTVVDGVGWVVVRHELDYAAAAFEGDDLEVTTWVPECTALTCERCYEVMRMTDGAVLARGRSTYCVVDAASGRPRRMGEALRAAIGSPPLVRRNRTERTFPAKPPAVIRA